jgi:hypothetical protein
MGLLWATRRAWQGRLRAKRSPASNNELLAALLAQPPGGHTRRSR